MNKQIEEMARELCPFKNEYENCNECFEADQCDIEEDGPCYYHCTARLIIDNDYRKQSDTAREIFEEIERETKNHGICYAKRKIAELKKKYGVTEDARDN